MFMQTRQLQAWVFAIALLATDAVWAGVPTATTITCNRMCPKCGQKISERLRAMPGVADAQLNVEGKTIVIVPQPQHALSPRVLWETVENGGEFPVLLQGPAGFFTQKPTF